ncbi:MAG TPA: tetratricopeptide repeat protein [Sedimentisphaerales bacterium]|nr:tetratricopeptide repeat protein [Sedimentisphaerales bacterium]
MQVAEDAAEIAPDNPLGRSSQLLLKLGTAEDPQQIEAMAPDFLALTEQFPNSALAYTTLLRYYGASPAMFVKNIDLAVDAARKAFELEQTVPHALALCDLLYRRAYIRRDMQDISEAMGIVRKALELPDAQVTTGPRGEGNLRVRRLPLYYFLAVCGLDKTLEWDTGADSQRWLKETEEAVAQIEQIFGSGDNPYVLMWHGMTAYARGQKAEGIRRMYAAYSRFRATDDWNSQSAQVAYWLARAHADSDEDGAVFEFLGNALTGMRGSRGTIKPDTILDFAEMAMKLRLNEYAVNVLDQYEAVYGQNDRSRRARTRALLASGKVDEATRLLNDMPQDAPDTLLLRLQLADAELRMSGLATEPGDANAVASQQQEEALAKHMENRIELINRLLAVAPNEVDTIQLVGAANYFIRTGQIEQATEMVDKGLSARPDDTALQLLRMRLSEPNPSQLSEERGRELGIQVLSNIADPFQRAIQLGRFYTGIDNFEAAAEHYTKALELNPKDPMAINLAFDLAVRMEDPKRARELAAIARAEDLDYCGGRLYEARVAMLEDRHADALPLLDWCINHRPTFSLAYLFRSEARDRLGMEAESISDAARAAELNPLGVQATRQYAILLNRRNERLGTQTTAEQAQQAREALIRAVAANPADSALLAYYIHSISQERPDIAFAQMQRIYQVSPTNENAMRLGEMAIRLSRTETDSARRMAMMQIAGSVLEDAHRRDPSSRQIVQIYAAYHRAQGQMDKAEALIKSMNDADLMWRYHLSVDQLDQARAILEKLYADAPKNPDTLRGLILVSQRSNDRQNSIEYSRQLAEIDDGAESQLNYIQELVSHNMAAEAHKQLDILKARYPDEHRGDLLRAMAHMTEGKYVEARDITNRVLQTHPNDAGAWRLRGELDTRLGHVDQAIASLQRSKLISDSVAIRISLARTLIAEGRHADAIEELRAAMPMEEGLGEAEIMLEQIYQSTGRTSDLRAMYDYVLARYPANYVWLVRAAGFHLQNGENSRALDYYRRAWRASEDAGAPFAAALNGWLTTLRMTGQNADAVALASRYADGPLAPIALVNMAEAAFAMQDRPRAMQHFERALERSVHDSAMVLMVVDRMYNLLGHDDYAIWSNQRLQKDSSDIVANVAMYNLFLREGKIDEALEYGERIVALAGPQTEAGLAYRNHNTDMLLQAYLVIGDEKYRTRAIQALEGLVADLHGRPPMLAKVRNNLAYVLARANTRLDEALEHVRKAHDAVPFDGNILDTYAFVHYARGEYKEARERIRASVHLYERAGPAAPPEVYERLGRISERLGETQEALAAYRRVLEVGRERLSPAQIDEINAVINRLASGSR